MVRLFDHGALFVSYKVLQLMKTSVALTILHYIVARRMLRINQVPIVLYISIVPHYNALCLFVTLNSNQALALAMAQGIDINGFLRKLANGNLNEARRSLGLNLWPSQSVNFASQPLSR